MKQYIDFEVARKYLHKVCESLGGNGGMMLKIKFDEEPKADVVEVVRCRDCENWDDPYCIVLDDAFDEKFFCALGERRKNEV